MTQSRGVAEDRADGTPPSFEAWAQARVGALTRFAYLVTGSQHAAEDAVQTALTRAFERWGRVSRTDDPDRYVRRMVVNAHVSGWRRTRRESPVELVRDPATPIAGPARTHPATSDPAHRVAEDDAVWKVCQALPRQQRAAVVLRFYEDLDYPEIAAVLGVAEPTVRSHVHRALTALRTALTEQEES